MNKKKKKSKRNQNNSLSVHSIYVKFVSMERSAQSTGPLTIIASETDTFVSAEFSFNLYTHNFVELYALSVLFGSLSSTQTRRRSVATPCRCIHRFEYFSLSSIVLYCVRVDCFRPFLPFFSTFGVVSIIVIPLRLPLSGYRQFESPWHNEWHRHRATALLLAFFFSLNSISISVIK